MKLTDKGLNVYNTIEENMNHYYKTLLEDIPENKHDQLIESLRLLGEAIKNNKCC